MLVLRLSVARGWRWWLVGIERARASEMWSEWWVERWEYERV